MLLQQFWSIRAGYRSGSLKTYICNSEWQNIHAGELFFFFFCFVFLLGIDSKNILTVKIENPGIITIVKVTTSLCVLSNHYFLASYVDHYAATSTQLQVTAAFSNKEKQFSYEKSIYHIMRNSGFMTGKCSWSEL